MKDTDSEKKLVNKSSNKSKLLTKVKGTLSSEKTLVNKSSNKSKLLTEVKGTLSSKDELS